MKTKRGITILLLLLSFALMPPFFLKVSAQSAILADIINSSASAVNYTNCPWINRESLTHMGIILGELPMSAYDAEAEHLASVSDWVNLVGLIRLAEIDGYTSATLKSLGTQALNAHQMVGVLPANWQDLYLNYYRDELHIYDYANQWGVSKWNLQDAYNAFVAYYQACSTFPWSIGSGQVTQQDDRHYDGGAQTLDAFLEFDEMGVPGALAQADNVWNKINSYPWPGYYPYHLGSSGTECEIGFSMIAGDYASRKGAAMTYADRLITDINYKLLANGWLSADWAPGGYVFCHAFQNTEHRLPNTQDGIMVLQAYYPQFTNAMKTSFQQLLQGYGDYLPAWQGLLTTDLVEQKSAGVNLFRPDSLNSWSIPRIMDSGTALACQVMFLEGIIPVTGSLNIPKRDEIYEDVCSAMSAKDFLFDYANHRIKIPVLAGQIKFQFGSDIASYTFPTSDTYTVQFSSDWNSVISARTGEHGTWIVDDDGPANFHTIQEAINAASDGDTIFVRSGTYFENVVVNRTLSLVGESSDSVFIDGNHTGNPVTITVDHVQVSGFSILNGDRGVYLNTTRSCKIVHNSILDNQEGIELCLSNDNSLSGNNITNNVVGIDLGYSSNNILSANNVTENSFRGINLANAADNNSINGNNIIASGYCGVWLDSSNSNNVSGNNITANNDFGIRILFSSGNIVYGNNIESNYYYGILLESSTSNIVTGNNMTANYYYGIGLEFSSYNSVYHNNFRNNALQVHIYETSSNSFHNGYPSGGNYWSDYNGTDADNDGIGDTPYGVDENNTDSYPLMNPWAPPDVAVANLSTSKTILGQGFPLNFSAAIQNLGSKIEVFAVDAYLNGSLLTSTNYTLTSGNLTLSAILNTTGFAKGNYSLTMSVEPLQDEVNVTNNNMTANVFITISGDLNGDKTVNIFDAILLASSFGSTPSSPHWNPNTDVNNDGTINIFDAILLAANYGKSWT